MPTMLTMLTMLTMPTMLTTLTTKVRRIETERLKNEFVENRAARQMQNMARAGRFARKLLEKSRASSDEVCSSSWEPYPNPDP